MVMKPKVAPLAGPTDPTAASSTEAAKPAAAPAASEPAAPAPPPAAAAEVSTPAPAPTPASEPAGPTPSGGESTLLMGEQLETVVKNIMDMGYSRDEVSNSVSGFSLWRGN